MVHTSLHHEYTRRLEEAFGSLRTEVSDGCELLCGCGKLKSSGTSATALNC